MNAEAHDPLRVVPQIATLTRGPAKIVWLHHAPALLILADGHLSLWDARTGLRVDSELLRIPAVNDLAVASNDTAVLVGQGNEMYRLGCEHCGLSVVDLLSGKHMGRPEGIRDQMTKAVGHVAISRDDRVTVLAASEGIFGDATQWKWTVHVYRPETGAIPQIIPVSQGPVRKLRIDPSGSILYAEGCRAWEDWPQRHCTNPVFRALDIATGATRFEISELLTDWELAPDRGALVLATERGRLVWVDGGSGRMIEDIAAPDQVVTIAISPDANQIWAAFSRVRSQRQKVDLVDPQQPGPPLLPAHARVYDRRTHTWTSITHSVTSGASFSPDGTRVAVLTVGGRLVLLDSKTLHVVAESGASESIERPLLRDVFPRMLGAEHPTLQAPSLTYPGEDFYVAVGNGETALRWKLRAIELIDTRTGRVLRRSERDQALDAAPDPTGRSVQIVLMPPDKRPPPARSGRTRELIVEKWNARTGELLTSMTVNPTGKFEDEDDRPAPRFASLEARHFVNLTGNNAKPLLAVRSLPEGICQARMPNPAPLYSEGRVVFHPNGASLVVGTTHAVASYSLPSGKEHWSVPLESQSSSLALSRDGKYVLMGQVDGSVRLLRAMDGTEIWSGSHETTVDVATFDETERYAVTKSRLGTVRIGRVDSSNSVMLVSATRGAQRDWIMYSPDGYFDASRGGGDLLAAARDFQGYRIDQLAVRNNRPDILLDRMGLGTEELISHYRIRHERRLDKLGLQEASLSSTFEQGPVATILEARREGKVVHLRFEAVSERADLLRYNIYVNNVAIGGALGKAISGRRREFTERVELVSGGNKIEVGVLDAAGVESLRPFRTIDYGEPAEGDLYFVGFGVSRYRNPAFNLSYAHKDALDIGAAFKAMRGKGFREVHVATLVNEQVTPDAIRTTKALLRHARVDDTVVLFIAGHGLHTRDAAADYYYGTYDMNPEHLPETAASFEQIEELLQDIAPRRKLFLMDTCESGERDESEILGAVDGGAARGLRPRAVRALARVAPSRVQSRRSFLFDRERYIYNDLSRRTGTIVLSSARGWELSHETSALQNGVFTKEVLRALTTDVADVDKNGTVSTEELRVYVASAVAKYTNDKQHPVVDRDNLEAKFGFPIVRSAE